MKTRTLKRKVIIREYDYERVKRDAFMPIGLGSIYDRAEFTPLNQDSLEKIKLEQILRGRDNPFTVIDTETTKPYQLLSGLRDYLYNNKYLDWHVTEDEEGYICVQARKNTPKSRLGYAVFEKDLVSRL
jgi:hypothetical protein